MKRNTRCIEKILQTPRLEDVNVYNDIISKQHRISLYNKKLSNTVTTNFVIQRVIIVSKEDFIFLISDYNIY